MATERDVRKIVGEAATVEKIVLTILSTFSNSSSISALRGEREWISNGVGVVLVCAIVLIVATRFRTCSVLMMTLECHRRRLTGFRFPLAKNSYGHKSLH